MDCQMPTIKRTTVLRNQMLGLLLAAVILPNNNLQAQNGAVMGGNVVSSTMTGALLGAATMGLQNESQFTDPLRVGVGLGILGGIGLSVYDLVQTRGVAQPVRHGAFITTNNTGTVLLVDTIYGAVAGSLIGTAIILVSNQPLVDGLQYGGSVGAWMGFTFGLVDAFVLSQPNVQWNSPTRQRGWETPNPEALVFSQPSSGGNPMRSAYGAPHDDAKLNLRFLQPGVVSTLTAKAEAAPVRAVRPTINVVSFRLDF